MIYWILYVCFLPAFCCSIPALVPRCNPLTCTHGLWQCGPELLCMFQLLLHVTCLHRKHTKNQVRHYYLNQNNSSLVVLWGFLVLTNRSKLVPAAVVGLASGL